MSRTNEGRRKNAARPQAAGASKGVSKGTPEGAGHDEARVVAERYARRDVGDRYSPLRPEVWQAQQERQRALLRLLARHARRPLAELDVLEVGCGDGANLLELLRLGFDPARLVANELLPERVASARRRLPAAVTLWAGDATQLPLDSARFDIVLQSTVFSSLLDDAFQQRLAARMWAWLKPGGAVLWYDFTVDNPRNRDVRGVPLRRMAALFPAGRIEALRVTLAPPIARRVVRLHPAAWRVFNALPLLRTHLLAWIEKPP
jgi:SAM-dependent methyltransferase